MSRRVYLDHNASTPVHPDVVAEMLPYFGETFGNPSSVHAFGRAAREGLDQARERVGAFLKVRPEEIVFTSGGTESDNAALLGAVMAARLRGVSRPHVVTTAVEHKAVIEAIPTIELLNGCATVVGVDRDGRVDTGEVLHALTADTVLVSVQAANNEVGTLQPVKEIARETARRGVPLHVDAVQLLGTMELRVDELGAALVTISSHKVCGPKGIAGLFVAKGMALAPWTRGGGQEGGLRGGTENVAAAVGFARAVELALDDLDGGMMSAVEELRDKIRSSIAERFPDVLVNTPAVSNLIRQGKLDQLETTMQSGSQHGMRTMDSAIEALLNQRTITGKEAYKKGISKTKFEPVKDQG